MQAGSIRLSLVALGVLALAGSDRAADDPPAALPEPGSLIILGHATADGRQTQSLVSAWDRKAAGPRLLTARRSKLVGDLNAIALARDGRYYYLSINRAEIIRAGEDGEEIVHRHSTYVRDLALDDRDNLYFSEASGAREDGKIYRVVPAEGGRAVGAELVCTVPLGGVDRFWAGDFAFARSAAGSLDTDTLYLSSGNRVPSWIYRMTRRDGTWGKPERVFEADSTIEGLVMTGPREACYVSDNRVFQLDDLTKPKPVLTPEGTTRLRDLTVVPAKP